MADAPIVYFLVISLLTAGAICLIVLTLGPSLSRRPQFTPDDVLSEPRTFVFSDGYLVSHTGGAGFLLPTPINHLTAWDSLAQSLNQMIDGAAESMTRLASNAESFRLHDRLGGDQLTLVGLQEGNTLRITLSTSESAQTSVRIDKATLESLHVEIANLRRASETNPALSWCVDGQSRIIWANSAYRAKLRSLRGEAAAMIWPIPALFTDESSLTPGTLRRKLPAQTDAPDTANAAIATGSWYELTISEVERGGRFVHAVPLDKVIKAEDALRTFIQTLTKTFAHLPTGLAIFDKERRLTLFNPALTDLTGLDGAWLSQRPTLEAFFDHLREMQRIPEPKNYKAWRESLTQLDRTSDSGTFEETWTLSDGVTFRVTGRPHADGAVALLIEDISAEIGITRRFRSELNVFQSVLDTSEEATIVFSSAGQVTLSNAAYADLWGNDPRYTVATASAAEAIGRWQQQCEPSPLWAEMRDFISRIEDRAEWFEDVLMLDGRVLQVRVSPIAAGMTLIAFQDHAGGGLRRGAGPLLPEALQFTHSDKPLQ